MADKAEVLNDVLVKLFNKILSIEEEAITKAAALGVTMSEIHVIEAIGTDEPKSMSEVASTLGVTMGTLTASVNRLVHKGHVSRFRPEEDRRVVLVTLTEDGRLAHSIHERFHRRMINGILQDLDEESQDAIIVAAEKLYEFFERVKPEDLLLDNDSRQ
ncbi:MAG: MarR family transcriptional regulator [Bacillota bacterium]|jgi:DNA-binding MarR family transcriptional regulator|nr:MarR family transcriptional regulator [Bacillota bacterium]HOK70211.1 MarR family transcriptional regulator [Bacillota bacterium]HOL52335.1 MarR family transcriptional regulator [Bacillota bacterium]HOO29747.1 MarR family transcriptional regulator [Bacillota bacterium]HPQ02170.1 MarR family transcriptional regulator [Bacillota bacterium]